MHLLPQKPLGYRWPGGFSYAQIGGCTFLCNVKTKKITHKFRVNCQLQKWYIRSIISLYQPVLQ